MFHSPMRRRRYRAADRGRRLAAVAPAALLPLLGALVYFVWLPGGALAQAVYGFTKLFTLIWPLVALAWVLRQPWPRPAPAREWLRALPLGIVSGVGVCALFWIALQTPLGEVVRAGAPAIRAKTEALGILEYYWAFALFLSLLHSGIEEYYWRWFLFGNLSRLVSSGWAHVLAAVAFAAHHVVIAGVFFGWGWGLLGGVGVAVGGLIWSGLYRRQGTVAGAWVSHAVVDLGLMAIGYRLIFA